MEVSSSADWKLEHTIATCGGPSRLWRLDVRRPEAGVSLHLSSEGSLTPDHEPPARVFGLSLEGGSAQDLRLADVFAKANHLYSRYEDWTTGDPREGLDIHVGLTAARVAAEGHGEIDLSKQPEEHEEYVLEAVISAKTENLSVERDVRIGFQGWAEEIGWQRCTVDPSGRRTATVPLSPHQEPPGDKAAESAGVTEFSFPVVGLSGVPCVLGLLVHPAGIRPLKQVEPIIPLTFDFRQARFSLVYRLFPLCLEKGVTVRGVFQLLLLRRANATERLTEAARRFLSSPPSLTEA